MREHTARGIYLFGPCVLVSAHISEPFCILPGGHIEANEHAEQALRREWLEEVGMPLTAVMPLTTIQSVWYRGGDLTGDRVDEQMALFVVRMGQPPGEGIMRLGEADLRFRWAVLGNLPQEHLVPLEVIPWVIRAAGGRYG